MSQTFRYMGVPANHKDWTTRHCYFDSNMEDGHEFDLGHRQGQGAGAPSRWRLTVFPEPVEVDGVTLHGVATPIREKYERTFSFEGPITEVEPRVVKAIGDTPWRLKVKATLTVKEY